MYLRRFLIVCLLVCASGAYAGEVSADNPKFQYTGRIDFSDKAAPKMSWPGTYVKARFSGTSLKVILNDDWGHNSYNVSIDGNHDKPHIIRCKRGRTTYDVATGLEDKPHSVLIFKRTEGKQGHTLFHGLVLDDGAKLLDPEPRPKLRMECIGDSITCGFGNEGANKQQETNRAFKNNFLAYGAITAWNLGADYMCTARSGIGLIKSWENKTINMQNYYDRLHANDFTPNAKMWDYSKWQANIVVINLFQNDSALVKHLPPDGIIDAYAKFVKRVRGNYPKAHIFCTLGAMAATKGGSPWPGYIKSAVQKVNEEGDKKVDACIFTGQTGWRHPVIAEHQQMAKELTAFIKEHLKMPAGGSGGVTATMRTWTSRKGTTIEAVFVKESGGRVFLKKEDGATIKIPRRMLSKKDLEYLRSLKK